MNKIIKCVVFWLFSLKIVFAIPTWSTTTLCILTQSVLAQDWGQPRGELVALHEQRMHSAHLNILHFPFQLPHSQPPCIHSNHPRTKYQTIRDICAPESADLIQNSQSTGPHKTWLTPSHPPNTSYPSSSSLLLPCLCGNTYVRLFWSCK